MPSAPAFWWREPGWATRLLAPPSFLYGMAAARRLRAAPRAPVGAPVLCIGNFSVGGSGKTPVAIALAKAAAGAGRKPGILSRGHGGRGGPPRLVDLARDRAEAVGDEPLLLAAAAPVAVGADRAAGARLLVAKGCDFLLMDDGFQSARIGIDFALLLIDRRFGLGNGFCLPAGPLRAPLGAQLAHADGVLAMGEGAAADAVLRQAAARGLPVWEARLAPVDAQAVAGRRWLAFAGIGHPQKFFASVAEAGGTVALARAFPDHHAFSAAELAELERGADKEKLGLLTTAKDAARLRAAAGPGFLSKLAVLEVEARFADPEIPAQLIERACDAWEGRARK